MTTTHEKPKPKVHQITNYEFDERYYQQTLEDGNVMYAPSVTHVLGTVYPDQGGALTRWIGDVGNRRAEEVREEAAEDGSFTHGAVETMLGGGSIQTETIRERFIPHRARKVLRSLKAFQDWHQLYEPEVIDFEYTTWDPEFSYAGTVDLHCLIDYSRPDRVEVEKILADDDRSAAVKRKLTKLEERIADSPGPEESWIDLKRTNSVHDSHRVQVAAYHWAENQMQSGQCAILHLGNDTKKRYSFLVQSEEQREKYLAQWQQALSLFQTMNPNARPTTETFPEVFTLNGKELPHGVQE